MKKNSYSCVIFFRVVLYFNKNYKIPKFENLYNFNIFVYNTVT